MDRIDRALYDDGTLARWLAMRRTMWAVPADLAAVVAAACGRAVPADERRRLVGFIEAQGLAPDALAASPDGLLTGELQRPVPDLATTARVGDESKWATDVTLASRVLTLLSCDARAVRGCPPGSWTSTRVRYVAAAPWGDPLDEPEAPAELARRWLAAFGPCSADPVADRKWWGGWSAAAARAALAAAGDVPSLDPTTMGWTVRDAYLGDLGALLFDRNGNAGPAVWWSGRVVGGWARRADGEVVTRILADVGRDGADAIASEAGRLESWLRKAGAVVKPRFPTPLQTELAA